MSFLSSIFGKAPKPNGPESIRDTLFGDLPVDRWPPGTSQTDSFPWSTFITARAQLAAGREDAAVACWREVLADSNLESRHHLQAWHFLRARGQQPAPDSAKQVLGVVVEVGMPAGLDILAAYSDHSARYYNFSGAGVVWEHPDTSLDSAIDDLLAASRHVVVAIGPWEDSRPPAPPRDHARMSFLTPSGLHFGQGPMAALSQDPLGGQVLHLASRLMQALIAKTKTS